MPSQTSYAQLWLYNNAEDKQQLFESFRENLDGTAATSNMMKIDSLLSQANTRMTAAEGDIDTLQSDVSSAKSSITELESDVGNLQNAITELQNDSSLTTAKATSTDNSNYTATVEGMTEYKTNMVMVIYLGSTNTGAVTVNVNSLGAKNLMKIGSAGTAVALEAEDMKANVGYLFQYDGTQFVLLQEVTVKDLYKTFLEFEETDEVVPPAPIDADRLGGIPAANYLQKIYNAGSNNLLVNPRFKYNSRDQSSYTGTGWTVDGWKIGSVTVTVENNQIIIPSGGNIWQPIAISELYKIVGHTVTISFCDSSNTIYSVSGQVNSEPDGSNSPIFSLDTSWGSIVFGNTDTNNFNGDKTFSVAINATSSVTLKAAKLELGSTSTLQADLDNPPSEDIEKLKLDMYDLDPGRCAYLPWHNENLLDNWYFVGGGSQQGGGQFPINQRGQTEYTGVGYTVDRWISNASSTLASVVPDGISISVNNLPINTRWILNQLLESYSSLAGKTVTVSLALRVTSGSVNVRFYDGTEAYISRNATSSDLSVISASGTVSNSPTQMAVIVLNQTENADFTLVAAKLELGYLSTLARKDEEGNWVLNDAPPNFRQELAKCQRYYLKTVSNQYYPGCMYTATNGVFLIPTPVQMRTIPTFSLLSGATLRCYDNTETTISASNIIVEGCDATGIKIILSGIQEAKEGTASFADGSLEFLADL